MTSLSGRAREENKDVMGYRKAGVRLTFSSGAGAMFAEVAGTSDWLLYTLDDANSSIEER
jgi:hypothetical protein